MNFFILRFLFLSSSMTVINILEYTYVYQRLYDYYHDIYLKGYLYRAEYI